jgi:putative tryptophan/tyrosine transport system substrate-binding protein
MRLIGLAVVLAVSLTLEPLATRAQQPEKVSRVGYLGGGSRERVAHLVSALEGGLRDLGYSEGRNIVFEHRYADGKLERLPELAADMARIKLDVIVASNPQVVAVRQATTIIPIVMVSVPDPVGRGLVATLARPGGNITGLASTATTDIYGKRLELLKELSPRVSRVAALWPPAVPGRTADLQRTEEAAQKLKLTVRPVPARTADDIEDAFGSIVKERVEALIVVGAEFLLDRRGLITALAAKNRLPAMYQVREFVEAGGLVSYGVDQRAEFRRAAVYVDKILKGAKPADLPVEQPTKFELVINMKTARALGLTIPQTLLLRADQMIE